MIAYKVVKKLRTNKLVSSTDFGHVTEYNIGQTVERGKNGPFCLFKTRSQANYWVLLGRDKGKTEEIILKCRIKKSKAKNLWYFRNGDKCKNRIISEAKHGLPILPFGTVLADKVTPLEVVE